MPLSKLDSVDLSKIVSQALSLKMEMRPLSELKPLGRCARTHTKKQVELIGGSILRVGFVAPVLIDAKNHIIAGNARCAGAVWAGLKDVPVVILGHLTEADKRAYVLADNRLAELGGWDKSILADEFKDLIEIDGGFDFAVTGFTTLEIEAITFGPAADVDDREEIAPRNETGAAVSQPGDLWRLGRHLLLCGDATSEASYVRLMGEDRACVCFTDPPYNVAIQGHVTRAGAHREFPMASGEMTDQEFIGFLELSLAAMRRASVEGAVHYVAMDWRHIKHLLAAGEAVGFELLNIITWVKDQAGMGSFYRSQSEFFCVFRTPGASHVNNVELGRHGRNRSNVWNYAGFNSFRGGGREELAAHPTPKPVSLVKDALLDCTKKGDLVLDPFSGGGSTLIAAERTGRRARVMELDPLYVDSALHRWEAMSGGTAVHVETGLTWRETRELRRPSPGTDRPACAVTAPARVRARTRSTAA